jgi:hypothetical protein
MVSAKRLMCRPLIENSPTNCRTFAANWCDFTSAAVPTILCRIAGL